MPVLLWLGTFLFTYLCVDLYLYKVCSFMYRPILELALLSPCFLWAPKVGGGMSKVQLLLKA